MIKRFAQCLREYKWTALVSPVCMIGEVAMEVTIPLVMADLYDYGIAMSNMTVVWQKALQLLLCALASLLFGCLSADYASKAATGFARNLRHDMYYRVQDFSFSNIDKFSSASIVTRLTSDAATIQMAFQMMIRMAIRCPMMLILATVSSLRISPKLSTVYFIAIPLLALVLLGIIPLVFRIFDRVFKTYDRLNTVVQENVHGIRVVKSFVREDKEVSKFEAISLNELFSGEHISAEEYKGKAEENISKLYKEKQIANLKPIKYLFSTCSNVTLLVAVIELAVGFIGNFFDPIILKVMLLNASVWIMLFLISVGKLTYDKKKLKNLKHSGTCIDSEIKDIIPASWIRVGNYICCRIVCGFIYEGKEYKAVSNYYVLTPFQRKEDLYANVFIEQNNPTKYSIELFQESR